MNGSGFKILGREPIEILTAIQAALALAMVTPWLNAYVTPEAAAWILTATSAIFGVVEAFAVRPMTPALLGAAIRTLLTAAALFGVIISEEFSLALVGFATYAYGKLTRQEVTPVAYPAPGFLSASQTGSHGHTRLRGTTD